jgi:hypothetical protein
VQIRVTHTYQFSKLNVWGINTTICPEPFQAIGLMPGQVLTWSIGYSFIHEPGKK